MIRNKAVCVGEFSLVGKPFPVTSKHLMTTSFKEERFKRIMESRQYIAKRNAVKADAVTMDVDDDASHVGKEEKKSDSESFVVQIDGNKFVQVVSDFLKDAGIAVEMALNTARHISNSILSDHVHITGIQTIVREVLIDAGKTESEVADLQRELYILLLNMGNDV